MLRIGGEQVEGGRVRVVAEAVRAFAEAVELLHPLEALAPGTIDAHAVPAGVLDQIKGAVGGQRVRPGQVFVERLPRRQRAGELLAPEHAVVPAIDDEVVAAGLDDAGGRVQVRERQSAFSAATARKAGSRSKAAASTIHGLCSSTTAEAYAAGPRLPLSREPQQHALATVGRGGQLHLQPHSIGQELGRLDPARRPGKRLDRQSSGSGKRWTKGDVQVSRSLAHGQRQPQPAESRWLPLASG